VGEVTFNWAEDGTYTTGFLLETGLNAFSKTSSTLPAHGRNATYFSTGRTARSLTLTSAQLAQAGASTASGNHLYYRLAAVNKDASGVTATHYYPYLQAVLPRPEAPQRTGASMRVASFNVRTARATTDAQTWLQRAPDVAKEIVSHNPGLVAVQELGPGRADGMTGTLQGHIRQTDSLLQSLDAVYGEKYDLVRTTPYVAPGVTSNTQGMRILYDNTRYSVVSFCPEKTGTSSYSDSCSFKLPILSTDTESARRRAVYAKFQDKASGKLFWFVSTHLDARHSSTSSTEATYNALRKNQATVMTEKMDALNTDNLPIIVGGDFNSWQNNRIGNGGHDVLIDDGYYDTSAALARTNFQYSTMNDFKLTMPVASQGVGVRIDMLFVKGARGSSSFTNVMKVTDSTRPSDHNMIVSDVALFDADPYTAVSVRGTSRG
jgi:endonuclease/exonuclease/phosphatase family metal-dependent hydrolase